jgi:hypothetical protein
MGDIRWPFKRPYNISLHRVYDRVRIIEGDERLELCVDADPMRMVAGLNDAQRRLRALTDESSDEQLRECALYFASVIFGQKQADALIDFYHGDPGCVIRICGQYFSGHLAEKIARAQKKSKT